MRRKAVGMLTILSAVGCVLDGVAPAARAEPFVSRESNASPHAPQ